MMQRIQPGAEAGKPDGHTPRPHPLHNAGRVDVLHLQGEANHRRLDYTAEEGQAVRDRRVEEVILLNHGHHLTDCRPMIQTVVFLH